MLEILPIDTATLGDRSYLVSDGAVAAVIDPQRDIDRVLELAAARGVRITHVFETHIHNDYVTGGRALCDATGAAYHVNAVDPVAFDRVPLSDGDVVEVSPRLSVRALLTPGHTMTHLSFALTVDGEQVGVFTGGSLLFGSTGRPDLLGPDHTDELVHAQYRSAHRLAAELPDEAQVFPTHGFGSFCSATQTEGTASTIGHEKRVNPALTQDEERFVAELLAGLDAFPAYYAHMGTANLAAPADAPDLTLPALADAAELRRRIDAGEWVVDLRSRQAFAAGHVAGTLSFGLEGQFATYLGWLIPWGTPLTLLGETEEQVAEAQRELVRIGIERPVAAATGSPEAWSDGQPLRSFRQATFADLRDAQAAGSIVVLDVRRRLEREESHIAGSVHIPLHELLSRLDEVPAGTVWVHCAAGYRASIATSLLAAAGRAAVAVNDDYENALQSGLEMIAAA
jgi:glyoxylase-like metal-dependent hydrolase (beta-lactamase superfamily II)/rhodanese-related sulfurtransferase